MCGFYKYVREAWKKPKETMPELWKERLQKWRRSPSTVRVKRPTRIDRARSLGYKAKPGFIVVRQRVKRGGRMRPKIRRGRRSKRFHQRLNLSKNYQQVAEERANRKYINCEVLNSYWVADDGKYYWYEIILLDRSHPAVITDKDRGWITMKQHRGRAARGLTSAGRKSRGLRNKGQGAEKIRPSLRAKKRQGN